MKLIIQIPCYNEEENLAKVIKSIPKSIDGCSRIEILIIDDGSTDRTLQIAQDLRVDHIISHRFNRGLAASFNSGLKKCLELGADIIVNTDGDNQYPSELIPKLVFPIVSQNADFVIGDRQPKVNPNFSSSKATIHSIGKKILSWLASNDLKDPVSGFRAISKNLAYRLHIVNNFSYTVESIMQAVNQGFEIIFIPITTNHVARKSRLFKNVPEFLLKTLSNTIRIFFMYKAFKVLITTAIVLGIIGILPILRFVILYISGDGEGHIQSLIVGALVVSISALLTITAFIADLISYNRKLIENYIAQNQS